MWSTRHVVTRTRPRSPGALYLLHRQLSRARNHASQRTLATRLPNVHGGLRGLSLTNTVRVTAGSEGRLFMWGHVDDARACPFPQIQKELLANTSLAHAQVKESMPWTACFRQVHFSNSEI